MLKRLSLPLLICSVFAVNAEDVEKEAPKPEGIPASPAIAGDREGYEGGEWTAETFGNPTEGRVVDLKGHANKMLCVHYKANGSDKAAIKRETGFSAAEKGTLRASVYSGDINPPSVAFALCTGEKFNWQETEQIKLKSGWNQISIEMGDNKWKSAASEWKHESVLVERTDVRAVILLVYGQLDGVVYLDGLKIDRDDQTTGVATLLKRLGSDEFAERDEAEKKLIEIGRPALEAINEIVTTSQDPELQMRARRVQSKITPARASDRRTASRQGKELSVDLKEEVEKLRIQKIMEMELDEFDD